MLQGRKAILTSRAPRDCGQARNPGYGGRLKGPISDRKARRRSMLICFSSFVTLTWGLFDKLVWTGFAHKAKRATECVIV